MGAVYRGELVERGTLRLLELADAFGVPVLLTEQYPRGLGATVAPVRAAFDALTTRSAYLEKTSFGCCGEDRFETTLAGLLPGVETADRHVVIAGIEAHVCVMQTVLELRRSGSAVHLCWECVSGRGEEYREYALQRMQTAGAQLTNHESVAFEWARRKEHSAFKAMNRILRAGQVC